MVAMIPKHKFLKFFIKFITVLFFFFFEFESTVPFS